MRSTGSRRGTPRRSAVRGSAAVASTSSSAYPISTFTWLLIPEKFSDAAKRDAIKGFVKWALADGQNYTEALLYAKLPKEVVTKEEKAIAMIQ